MITSTPFYNNKNYPTKNDTAEKPDPVRMELVTNELVRTLPALSNIAANNQKYHHPNGHFKQ
jgi:hypothetical protein